jgi:hypothetical protein
MATKKKQPERELQSAAFYYFRMQYPNYSMLFFHIPNGGHRNVIEAKNLQRAGVVAGVADTFLAVPNKHYPGSFIEFKAPKGKMSENQMNFQSAVVTTGYDYKIIQSIDEFMNYINEYLKR